ncbi:hypothetical protein JXL83_07660 [candidate division WOR-3 bacterium]|nr:hypothetical protein [candidate division WOR-3 bacterium]
MSKFKSFLYFVLNIFRHNLKFKLISLFSSVILWFYVVLQTPYNRILDVPITVELPDSLLFDEPLSNSVKIEFVGTLRDFFLFEKFGSPYVYLNLQNINPGEHYIDILPENVIFSDWTGVETQGKSIVKISLQSLDSLYLPIVIEESFLPRSNWRIIDYTIRPDFTWVIGGREDLLELKKKPLILVPDINGNFGFDIQCTAQVKIPQMPTRPFSRDSFAVIEFTMDSLILIERKLPVTLTESSRFYAMPDSVKFFALVSASLIDEVRTEDIMLIAEPLKNEVHSSSLEIVWPYIEAVETAWVEIPKVRIIPK